MAAQPALAGEPVLPSGVVAKVGGVKIGTPADGVLTINQNSSKGIIDWTSFSIGAGGGVLFNNGSGATLNRVIGPSASQIDGWLAATGSVYLLNPNGVIVGKTGVIAVGGDFIAATLDLPNTSFEAQHDFTFSGPSTAAVVNLGKIGALGGDVVMIATRVDNEGQIATPIGAVGLLSGTKIILHDTRLDDGKFEVVTGFTSGSVTNGGAISAAEVELRANGGNIYALAGNTGSVIKATGVATHDGKVYLVAGAGSVTVAGSITARAAHGAAGFVETSGDQVTIGAARVDAGKGGLWLVDPLDLTIDPTAASTLSSSLQSGTNVTLQTGGSSGPGQGDILVQAPLSWSSSAGLTLDAYNSIVIDAPITVSGAGQISLVTSDGGSGGGLVFGAGASGSVGALTFNAGAGPQSLTVNGQAFSLIYTADELQNINSGGLSGNWALAQDIDLSSVANFTPIGGNALPLFSGIFEGFGHTLSNLNINYATPGSVSAEGFVASADVGLFGEVSGTVRNVHLLNAHVTAADGMEVGALAGAIVGGAILDSSSSGVVQGGSIGSANSAISAGGLVGAEIEQGSLIEGSSSSATVAAGDEAAVGGLLGSADYAGVVRGSFATGAVSSGASATGHIASAGGLVGSVYGFQFGGVNPSAASVTGSWATGAVTGGAGSYIGGFAGLIVAGDVADSSATGSVTHTAGGLATVNDLAGGFVGYVGNGGSVARAYATGPVTTSGGLDSQGVHYSLGGGFVGVEDPNATISDAYATSAVTSTGTPWSLLAGFAGAAKGTVTRAWASGPVSGQGGLAGFVAFDTGSVTASYWDSGSTGQGQASCCGGGGVLDVTAVGGASGPSPYAASTYAGLDLAGTWFLVDGSTRPFLRSEYSTTVTNTHQLQLMALGLGGAYTLANDISFAPSDFTSGMWNPATGFTPIGGNAFARFTGALDGQGHTIANLRVDDTTPVPATDLGFTILGEAGLFGWVDAGGAIRNITLADAHVTGGDGMATGALVGDLYGTVTNAAASGVVTGGSKVTNSNPPVGGLVGAAIGQVAVVSQSSSSAVVSGGNVAEAGGLVGSLVNGAAITDSHATGPVSVGSGAPDAFAGAGGLVGAVYGYQFGRVNPLTVTVTRSYATGNVTGGGGALVGGLAGSIEAADVTLSYASGSATFTGTSDEPGNVSQEGGGFVGFIGDLTQVTQSYATGGVTLVGGPDTNHYAFGGGFAGLVGQGASVSNDYGRGFVTAQGSGYSLMGGFTGLVVGTITDVYATGPVFGAGAVGGIAGGVNSSGILVNAYWDTQTSGLATPYASPPAGTAANVTGLSTAQFQAGLPAGFSTSIWTLAPGATYPTLIGSPQ